MSGDPYFDKVNLLCHFDGASATDVLGHTMSAIGTADIQTPGLYGDMGRTNNFPPFDYGHWEIAGLAAAGTGPFCFEIASKFGSYTGSQDAYLFAIGGFTFRRRFDGKASIKVGATTYTTSASITTAWPASEWRRIAITRDGANTLRLYIEGAMVESWASVTGSVSSGTGYLCALTSGDDQLYKGNIDELRYTIGEARYTGSSYTLASGPFPDTAGPISATLDVRRAQGDPRATLDVRRAVAVGATLDVRRAIIQRFMATLDVRRRYLLARTLDVRRSITAPVRATLDVRRAMMVETRQTLDVRRVQGVPERVSRTLTVRRRMDGG